MKMPDDGKNSPFGYNWQQFEEFFSGISSFQQGKIQDLSWVDKFIQNVMKQAVPEPVTNSVQPPPLQTEVFETHRNVIVKIRIPAHIQPRALQLFANSHQLKIEGPGQNVQYVRLPAAVQSQSSKAHFRDGILQLQLRKKTESERFDEVYIRFL
jgi:HSP20 family molecular chaperone IbpA